MYMESSKANNVGIAKFIHSCLYDTKTPAQLINPNYRTTVDGFPVLLYINDEFVACHNFNLDRYSTESYGYKEFPRMLVYEISANSDASAGAFIPWSSGTGKDELQYYRSDFECLYPPSRLGNDNYEEIKALINWVYTSSDEVFKDQIEEHFNLEYLLRYYLTVSVFGLVDSLGKNMKLVTYDYQKGIWYPQFYDCDTAIGLNNLGALEHGSDIEVVAGVFQTSGSVLWAKVRRLFAVELNQQYALMRLNRFTVENIMSYIYGTQIKAIPERVYNMDQQEKYLNFEASYLYVCHGNREHHLKRWIRERLAYCDSLYKYTSSASDYITIRANKLGQVYLDIETYIPLYLTVKFRDEPDVVINGEITNAGKVTKRIGRGEKVRFEYNLPTATNQEVIVYSSRFLKSLGDISNLNPEALLISTAKNLTNIKCSAEKLVLTDISKMLNLQNVDFSNCPNLGTTNIPGTSKVLDLQDCKYLKKIDVSGTQLTAINTNLTGGSIEEIYYPTTVQDINVRNQSRLKVLGLPYVEGMTECTSLANVDIQNCPNILRLSTTVDDVINFMPLKYTQKLNIKNSLNLTTMNFTGFNRLMQVTLDSLGDLETCGFDDLSNLNGTGILGNVTIANCPLIEKLTFNVTSPTKSIIFSSNSKLDLSQAYTLKRIESNTPILGLKTIILNRDIKDLIFTKQFAEHNFDSNIQNIWSYSTATENEVSKFTGIDFKDLFIQNLDMTTLKTIVNNKNFNIAPENTFIINQPRDGVAYPYLNINGTIDLSNYNGSCVGLFKNWDLSNVTIVKNKDFTQTDFTSMFEGAKFSVNTNITSVMNRIVSATSLDKMFKGSNITSCIDLPNLTTNHSRISMYENCTSLTQDIDIPTNTINVSNMFKGCSSMTHIHSNWNKSYVSGFISTNCYDGCYNITHIDGVVGTYDNIPLAWGGSGFTIDITHEIKVDTQFMSNRTVNLASSGLLTSWGDGSFDTLKSHTYANNGIYTIKTKNKPMDDIGGVKDCIIEYVSIPTTITSYANLCKDCTHLNKPILNIPDYVVDISSMYQGCTSLASLNNIVFGASITNCDNWIDGCSKLVSANNVAIKSNFVAQNIFKNNITITSSNDVLLSNVTDISNMYSGCTKLVNCGFKDLTNSSLITTNAFPSTLTTITFNGTYNRTAIQSLLKACPWQVNVVYGDTIPTTLITKDINMNKSSETQFTNLLEGSSKTLEVYGNTIQNLVTNPNNAEESCTGAYISRTCMLKTSTKYTVNYTSNLDVEIDLGGTKINALATETKKLITTPSTLTHGEVRFANTNAKLKNISVVEGDYMAEDDFNYFEGIQSVGEFDSASGKYKVEVRSGAKNLFDMSDNKIVRNVPNDVSRTQTVTFTNGEMLLSAPDRACATEFKIVFRKGISYTMSFDIILDATTVSNVTLNTQFTVAIAPSGLNCSDITTYRTTIPAFGKTNYSHYTKTFTPIQDSVLYLGGGDWNFRNTVASRIKNLQIEIGSTETPYIPYGQNIKTFLLDEPLRKIGDVADRLYWDSNKGYYCVERKIYKKILNGTEIWATQGGAPNQVNTIIFQFSDTLIKGEILSNAKVINDLWDIDIESLGTLVTGGFRIRILRSKLQSQDVNGFKAWLQLNNIDFLMKLQTPIIQDLPTYNQNVGLLRVWQDKTNIDTSNIIKPSNVKFVVKDIT